MPLAVASIYPIQEMSYLCAIAMYLFGEHYLMAEVHSSMGEILQYAGRFDEAAYHMHEALRIWRVILSDR